MNGSPDNFGPGYTDVTGGEGVGLYDLYNTYSHINYLFGDTMEGEALGLEAYDPYNEELLRNKYREDYRGMVGDITQANQEQSMQLNKMRAEGGKAGFAGSGGQEQNINIMTEGFLRDRDKQKGAFANLRQGLLGSINKERQDYESGLWSAYSTWLAGTPEQLSDTQQQSSTDCLAAGGYLDPATGACVMPGEDQYSSGYENWEDSV